MPPSIGQTSTRRPGQRFDSLHTHCSRQRLRQILHHSARGSQRRNDVFRVRRDTVLVQVHTIQFGFSRQAERSRRINGKHHRHCYPKRRQRDAGASDKLSFEKRESAAVEESSQWS